MTIVKNVFNTIKFSIIQIMRNNHKTIIVFLGDIIRRVIISFCLILIPQKIVSNMLLQQYHKGFYWVISLCTLILFNDILATSINYIRNKMQVDINIKLNEKLSSSVMNIEYEKIEKKSYLEKVDFARRCIDRNSVIITYENLIEVLSGIIGLCGMVFIISKLPASLIIVIVIGVISSSIGEVFRLNFTYDRDYQGKDIEKNLYYARNDLSSNKYAKDIRTWDLFQYISGKVELYAKKLCDLWSKTSIKSVKIIGWTYVVNGVQYILIYSFIAYLTYNKNIDVSEFVLYTSATISFGELVKKILGAFIIISIEFRYIESFSCLIKKQEKRPCPYFDIGFEHNIEFKDVWFKYEGAEEFLFKGLNLVIEKGKVYSIVGKNGAGKTTLVMLILGLYKPDKGKIFIDDKNIEEVDVDKYRELFSCVFQDYNIYGFSIQENISFGENNIKKMKEVITMSGLKDKIQNLSEGTQTLLNREVNKDAIGLSGGQAQQLAIARALYKNTELFILDEPTAALSPSSEFLLYQQFYKITCNKTVIFISHRMASCILCDEIIVINEGRIAEKGKHDILMKKRGLYTEMFNKQAKPYVE